MVYLRQSTMLMKSKDWLLINICAVQIIKKQMDEGVGERRVGFLSKGAPARQHSKIYNENDEEVRSTNEILSFSWFPFIWILSFKATSCLRQRNLWLLNTTDQGPYVYISIHFLFWPSNFSFLLIMSFPQSEKAFGLYLIPQRGFYKHYCLCKDVSIYREFFFGWRLGRSQVELTALVWRKMWQWDM